MADGDSNTGLTWQGRLYLALAFVLATGLIAWGLHEPALRVERLWIFERDITILGGMRDLAKNGQSALAGLLLLVSVIIPLTKTLTGALIALAFPGARASRVVVSVFAMLAKWSLADVFVLAIIVMVIDGQLLTSANLGVGIYLFTVGVLLSAGATFALEGALRRSNSSGSPHA